MKVVALFYRTSRLQVTVTNNVSDYYRQEPEKKGSEILRKINLTKKTPRWFATGILINAEISILFQMGPDLSRGTKKSFVGRNDYERKRLICVPLLVDERPNNKQNKIKHDIKTKFKLSGNQISLRGIKSDIW